MDVGIIPFPFEKYLLWKRCRVGKVWLHDGEFLCGNGSSGWGLLEGIEEILCRDLSDVIMAKRRSVSE